MDLLLAAIAGCMGMDVVEILQKQGGKIGSFKMVLKGEKNPEHPHLYSKIMCEITCKGEYIFDDLIEAFDLSHDKYCSVLATLRNPPEFIFSFL